MFLTIVTPFFNNLEYVKRCILSLEQQNDKDFELILINDASTQIVFKDLELLIHNRKIRIQLLNNTKNVGPGFSRNRGIQAARGEYILFLDSDDWLHNDTVSILKKTITDYQCDCVIFDYFLVKNKLISSSSVLIKMPRGRIEKKEALLYSTGSVCCKVYKTQLLIKNNTRFPNIYIKEDMVFNKEALSHCEDIFYLNEKLYYYNIHQNSLMHSEKVFEVTNDIIAFQELETILKAYPAVLEALFAKELLYAGTLNMLCSDTSLDEIKKFLSFWITKYPNWEKNSYLSFFPLRIRIFLRGIAHKNWHIIRGMAILKKAFNN